jgi:hypothetical protein
MLISLDFKFIFIANLKSASSSIEAGLRSVSEIALVESRFGKHMHFSEIEKIFPWILKLPARLQNNTLKGRDDFFVFGVIREPIDFLISLYNSHSASRFADDSKLYTGNMDFDVFLNKWTEANPDQVEPQYLKLLTNKGAIGADYIISYDKIDDGLNYVMNTLGLPMLSNLEKLNVSERRMLRANLSLEQRDWILTQFSADYNFMEKFCNRRLTPTDKNWEQAQSDETQVKPDPVSSAALVGPATAGRMKQVILGVTLVQAAYRTFFGREPDPTGLRDGLLMLQNQRGVEKVFAWILGSKEFSARLGEFVNTYVPLQFLDQASRAYIWAQKKGPTAPNAAASAATSALEPRVADFTLEQARLVDSLTTRPGQVLIAQYRPEPGSRPTIYVRNRDHLTQPRGFQSVEYLDSLISNYLLHPNFFHLYATHFLTGMPEQFSLVQIADCPDNIGVGVAFCSCDPLITLIPDPHFWVERGYFEIREQISKKWVPWRNRIPKFFWRGSSTGAEAQTVEDFQALPRFQLCASSAKIPALRDLIDAKLTNIVQAKNSEEADKIRALASSLGIMMAQVPQIQFIKYRYQIDIDGNSNSWSFLFKLAMGSCVLKVSSDWRQWYYDRLSPWEHYIPVNSDLSDLEQMVRWCLDNDADAERIAINGLKRASDIVFGTEMPKAAANLLAASKPSFDQFGSKN